VAGWWLSLGRYVSQSGRRRRRRRRRVDLPQRPPRRTHVFSPDMPGGLEEGGGSERD